MTKILILHASLGSGHVSAANLIVEMLKQLDVDEIRVEEGLDYADSFVRTARNCAFLRLF